MLATNSYKRGPLTDTNVLNVFYVQYRRSTILNFIGALSVNITYYVTTPSITTLLQTRVRLGGEAACNKQQPTNTKYVNPFSFRLSNRR